MALETFRATERPAGPTASATAPALEIGDALASWAVTGRQSPVPGDKRLAVHVEDHPLDHADFEEDIPEGPVRQRRGDRLGPRGDPVRGLKKGRLDFTLEANPDILEASSRPPATRACTSSRRLSRPTQPAGPRSRASPPRWPGRWPPPTPTTTLRRSPRPAASCSTAAQWPQQHRHRGLRRPRTPRRPGVDTARLGRTRPRNRVGALHRRQRTDAGGQYTGPLGRLPRRGRTPSERQVLIFVQSGSL